jgi:hypothetical protein
MQICFLCLRMRRISLTAWTRPIHVNRNDKVIAIASPSFFLNPCSARVARVSRHSRGCPCMFYHVCREFAKNADPTEPPWNT